MHLHASPPPFFCAPLRTGTTRSTRPSPRACPSPPAGASPRSSRRPGRRTRRQLARATTHSKQTHSTPSAPAADRRRRRRRAPRPRRWASSSRTRRGLVVVVSGATTSQAKVRTRMALLAKCNVDMVSSAHKAEGDSVATNAQRPPQKASLNKRVSFDARYGTWGRPSFNADTTLARADRDWLIDVSSLMRCFE